MKRSLHFMVAAAGVLAALAFPAILRAETSEVITLGTRGDARQRILLLRPDRDPVATVILYPGGNGNIGIQADGAIKNGTNFLVRSRALFAEQGFLVAVVDRPSDWAGSDKDHYRLTPAHADDAAAIAKTLRSRAALPIWFIGTSRGTISVASIASRLGRDTIAGIVLTSSVTQPGKGSPQTVQDADLSGIAVPVLVLGHENDDCRVTPWPEQQELVQKFRSSGSVEAVRITGGETGDMSSPCGPISHHGFLGQEKAVVSRIAEWIKRHQ